MKNVDSFKAIQCWASKKVFKSNTPFLEKQSSINKIRFHWTRQNKFFVMKKGFLHQKCITLILNIVTRNEKSGNTGRILY